MSFYDDLNRESQKVEQDTDVLGLRYDEFTAALNAQDWDTASALRAQIAELTNSVLTASLVGFMLVELIEKVVQDD